MANLVSVATAARADLVGTIERLVELVANEAAQTSTNEALQDFKVREYWQAIEKFIDAFDEAVGDDAFAQGKQEGYDLAEADFSE